MTILLQIKGSPHLLTYIFSICLCNAFSEQKDVSVTNPMLILREYVGITIKL